MAKYSRQIVVTAAPTDPAATIERWLRLTTDPPAAEAELTVAELAALLDELVGVPDPCSGAPAAPAADPGAALEEALAGPDCDAVAARLRIAANCSAARRTGQPLKANIYAHWSDEVLAEDYRVAPLGSALILSGPVRSSKVINLIVDVSDAASAPARYFVNEEARIALWRKQPPRWIGNVIDNKRIMPGPEISWGGGKVTFSGRVVSGRCELWLPIIYDTWTVSLPGVQVGDKRSYRAKFLGISGLLDQPADAEIEDEAEENPDANDCSACGGSTLAFDLPENPDVFCYEEVVTEFTRPCDDTPQGRAVEYRQVPCPENTLPQLNAGTGAIPALPNYISRQMTRRIASVIASSDYDAITKQDYIDNCGYYPIDNVCMPACMQIQRTWRGQAWPKKEDAIKRQYLGETEIVYVAPEDGICGKRIDRFSGYPCFQKQELYLSIESDDIIEPGGSALLVFVGGWPPYSFKYTAIPGVSVSMPDNNVPTITINAAADVEVCGSITITIRDACGEDADGHVRGTAGQWILVETWGIFNALAGQVAECIDGDTKYYEDYCGRPAGGCPGGCPGSTEMMCDHPPYVGDICTVEGRRTYKWIC